MGNRINRRRHIPYASRKRRFFNYLLDSIFVQLFYAMVGVVLLLALMPYGKQDLFFQWLEGLSDPVSSMFGIVLYMSYFNLFESWLGKTPAKFITRTRVLTLRGEKPGWLDIMGRSLCRIIPFDAFSFLFGADWHDRFSRTIVVSEL